MNKKSICQWFFLAIVCLVFVCGETYGQDNRDFANFGRFAKENAELPDPGKKEKRVVFLGNSITEGWVRTHPDFFKNNGYIGRGISGQTSYQFLLRFREDIIKLSPTVVVINAGTNDVAENTQAYNEEYTYGNIISMVELAKANKIKVILTTVLPHAGFGWNPKITDAPEKIKSLNARLKAYAKENKVIFVDYFGSMVSQDGSSMIKSYSKDGVHPNSDGYDVMEKLVQAAIEKAL